jgi:hypothetical protein
MTNVHDTEPAPAPSLDSWWPLREAIPDVADAWDDVTQPDAPEHVERHPESWPAAFYGWRT